MGAGIKALSERDGPQIWEVSENILRKQTRVDPLPWGFDRS
jgi:hypothetical protein